MLYSLLQTRQRKHERHCGKEFMSNRKSSKREERDKRRERKRERLKKRKMLKKEDDDAMTEA